jgi:hypothetical protein
MMFWKLLTTVTLDWDAMASSNGNNYVKLQSLDFHYWDNFNQQGCQKVLKTVKILKF